MEQLCRRARVRRRTLKIFLGEALGTFVATLIISSAAFQNYVTDGSNVFGTSFAFGVGITFGILVAAQVAPLAPLNPNIAFAFALRGDITWRLLCPYVLGELIGAALAFPVTILAYMDAINHKFTSLYNTSDFRGPENILFCSMSRSYVSLPAYSLDCAIGVFLLAMGLIAIIDPRNFKIPAPQQPFLCGLLVTALANCLAFNSGLPLNLAIDVTGRLYSALMGWGGIGWKYFWVPIVMPLIGAALGTLVYSLIISANLPRDDDTRKKDFLDDKTKLEPLKGNEEDSEGIGDDTV